MTPRQRQLLRFIEHYLASNDGISPSYAEMQTALDLKSKSGIHRLISALEQRGMIQRHHSIKRAIQVIRWHPDDGALPNLMHAVAEVERIAGAERCLAVLADISADISKRAADASTLERAG